MQGRAGITKGLRTGKEQDLQPSNFDGIQLTSRNNRCISSAKIIGIRDDE